MNIVDESFIEKEKKPKTKKIIMVVIILLAIAIIGIMVLLLNIRSKRIVVYVDGIANTELLSTLKLERDSEGEVVDFKIPVKKMAEFIGYKAYNGDYQTKSEEQNKCYVINDSEVANLTLQNQRIYKLDLSDTSTDYQYYDLKNKVEAYDGELYITPDAMEQVFNTRFIYNKSQRTIEIQTLQYLVQAANSKVMEYGFDKLNEKFANYKSIFDGIYIVSKGKEGQDEQVGIIDATTGKTLIEPKYTSMEYLPNIKDCIVADGQKYGVASPKEKRIKIQVTYDSIDLVDKDKGLYVIGKDKKYGIVDLRGVTKVPTELDEVGIDISKFAENNLKNRYLLVDNLIPAKQGDKWGLVDTDGHVVADATYDSLGYIATTNKNAKNLLVIPQFDVIVVCKNGKYSLINKVGTELFPFTIDDIYMTYENGKYNYYMSYNNQTYNVVDELNKRDIQSGTQNQAQQNQNRQQEQQNQEQQNQENQENQEQNNEEQNQENQENQEQNNEEQNQENQENQEQNNEEQNNEEQQNQENNGE